MGSLLKLSIAPNPLGSLIPTTPPCVQTLWTQRGPTDLVPSLNHLPTFPRFPIIILRTKTDTTYLLLYVDDIILTASSTNALTAIIDSLHNEFAMSDLGALHHFLGVNVHRTSQGLFLSQHQYALELIDKQI
jgi:hypothetical protein